MRYLPKDKTPRFCEDCPALKALERSVTCMADAEFQHCALVKIADELTTIVDNVDKLMEGLK